MFESGDVNISFLVLGYSSPETLGVFAKYFSGPEFKFFLHLDSKVNAADYVSRIEAQREIILVPNRYPIYWGGFNMIRATVELINGAKALNSSVMILISDDSLPLLGPEKFLQEIKRCSNRIDMYSASDAVRARYTDFYYFDSNATNARWMPTESRKFCKDDEEALQRLAQRRINGKIQGLNLRAGAQWWALESDIASEIAREIEEDVNLRESFEFSAIPDELLFQTLASVRLAHRTKMAGPMHADFSREPKPYVFSAPPLRESLQSNKLLIRKVDAAYRNFFMDQVMRGESNE